MPGALRARKDAFAVSDQLNDHGLGHSMPPLARPASQQCLIKASSYHDHYPRTSEPTLQSSWSSMSCRTSVPLGSSRFSGSVMMEEGHTSTGSLPKLLAASLSAHPTIGDTTSAPWDSAAASDDEELLQVERSGAGFANHLMLGLPRPPANLMYKDGHDKPLHSEPSGVTSMMVSYTNSSSSICLRSTSSFSGPMLSATPSESVAGSAAAGRFSRRNRCQQCPVTSTINAVASATHAAHQAASLARASPRLQQVLARSLRYTNPSPRTMSMELSKSCSNILQLRASAASSNSSCVDDHLVCSSTENLSMLLPPARSSGRTQYDFITDVSARTSSSSSLYAGSSPPAKLSCDLRSCSALLAPGEILPGSTVMNTRDEFVHTLPKIGSHK